MQVLTARGPATSAAEPRGGLVCQFYVKSVPCFPPNCICCVCLTGTGWSVGPFPFATMNQPGPECLGWLNEARRAGSRHPTKSRGRARRAAGPALPCPWPSAPTAAEGGPQGCHEGRGERWQDPEGEAAADYISQAPAGRTARPPPFPASARGLLGAVVGVRKKMASKISVVLRPVKSIVVRFCPFESNVESTRWGGCGSRDGPGPAAAWACSGLRARARRGGLGRALLSVNHPMPFLRPGVGSVRFTAGVRAGLFAFNFIY